MIDKITAADVLTAALGTGANFAEIFAENNAQNSLSFVNGVVEKAQAGIDYGVGIRIFDGFNAIYAYTNDTSRQNLVKVALEAAKAVKKRGTAKNPNAFETLNFDNAHVYKVFPKDVQKTKIVDMMREVYDSAKNYSAEITQTSFRYLDSIQDVLIVNSDGLWAEDRRMRTRMFFSVVASDETEKQMSSQGPGRLSGLEFYDSLNFAKIGRDLAKSAVKTLHAGYCVGGKMPVVVGNGFGGVILHEACVHSLEATSVAKKVSVFSNKMGQKIASDIVNATDDGTMPNEWGSINIDDEGTPAKRNVLLENGVLKTFLVDKLNGLEMGVPSTGSSRRESYRFAPTSRMTNTFFEKGTDTAEDIFGSTEYGLYAATLGGGSVDTSTGEFNFTVSEGYMIRNGKICEPVRGASLIGKGQEVLLNIDKISDDLELAQGMCGSRSGYVPTNVGQPMIRVKELLVGGRSE